MTAAPAPRAGWLGRERVHVVTCGSTNDLCAERARAGAGEGLVVTADAQTGGRGRLGRSWHSPPGENLYVSILLRPVRPAAEIPPLALLGGAAVARAARALGVAPELKWPNDVVVRVDGTPRKLAGVLTEASTEGERAVHVVMGIGINVDTTAFPPDLAARATSLRLARGGGAPLGTAAVLEPLLAELARAYDRYRDEGPAAAVAAWMAESTAARYRITLPDRGELTATATGIAPDGALLLRDGAGQPHRIVSGEVTLL